MLTGYGALDDGFKKMAHFSIALQPGKPLIDGKSSLQGLRVIWRLYEAEQAGHIADLTGLGLDEG